MTYKYIDLAKMLTALTTMAFMCLLPSVLNAQDAKPQPKVGLVLSGGGAKGFAHIGVLQVLEEAGLRVDYIAGTSMGAIIGALYSIGYTPGQIKEIVMDQNWLDLFDDQVMRRFLPMVGKDHANRFTAIFPIKQGKVGMPSGLITGQKLQTLLARLTWPVHQVRDFRNLPIPFRCLATNLENGQRVVLNQGVVSEALRASMSIPTVFVPMEIDGALLVDGGLVDNLPVAEVLKMGADIVVGVDVSATLRTKEQLNSLIEVLDQTINFQTYAWVQEQRKLCQLLLVPDLSGYTPADFNRVESLIEKGEQAAREALPELKKLMDSMGLEKITQPRPNLAPPESIFIYNIEIDGLSRVSRKSVISELGLKSNSWISLQNLNQAIDKVYSTQFFEKVSYLLEPGQGGNCLKVKVVEKDHQVLGLGFRYDSNTNAEILVGLNFKNLIGHSSLLAINLRLGDSPELKLSEFIHPGLGPGLGERISLGIVKYPVFLYQDGQRWASFNYTVGSGDIFLGTIYSKSLELGGGIRMEYFERTPDIAPSGIPEISGRHLTVTVSLNIDTYNRSEFPTRGHKISVSHIMANREMAGRADFFKKLGQWQGCFPLNKIFSFSGNLFWGNVSGQDIPAHYRFYLGGLDQRQGVISMAGLKPMELTGNNVMGLGIGAQYEAFSNRFIYGSWNIGKAGDVYWKDQINRQNLISGIAIGFGVLSPVGPIKIELMSGNRHAFLANLRLGYNF
jgi:NTE family protein